MEISIKWNLCRICLKPDKSELVSLYNDAKLAKQILECTGTAVSQSDGMPDQICKTCLGELQASNEFILKFRKSDKHIRAVVERTMSSTSSFESLHNVDTEAKSNRGSGDDGYDIKTTSRISSANHIGVAKDNKQKRLTNENILSPSRKVFKKEALNKVKIQPEKNHYDVVLQNVEEVLLEEDETEEDMMVDISTEFCDSEYIDNSPIVDENSLLHDKADYLEKNTVKDCKQEQQEPEIVDLCNIESKSDGEGEGDGNGDVDDNETECIVAGNTTPTIQQDGQNDYIIVLSGNKAKLKYDQMSNCEENVSKYIEFIPVDDVEGDTETEVAAEEDEQEPEQQELLNADDEHTGTNAEGDVYIPDFQKIGHIITDDDTSAEVLTEEVNESAKLEADDNDGNVRSSNKDRKTRPPPSKKLINVSRFICSICGNTFSQAGLLKTHMRMHRNERRFECELCYKQFASSHNLSNHMRIHTGEKPYECNYCSRRFADRSTHIKHERIHTNEKPFTCNTCGKSFTLSTTLKTHEATHSDEKPYYCYKCDKGFKLPHQLKAHLNTYSHKVVSDELKHY